MQGYITAMQYQHGHPSVRRKIVENFCSLWYNTPQKYTKVVLEISENEIANIFVLSTLLLSNNFERGILSSILIADGRTHHIMERKIFKSGNKSYDVDIFSCENSYTFRFYESRTERWDSPLSDLVIVPSSYGFLFLKFIADGAVVGGFLDKQHFSKDMVEDIMLFIEDMMMILCLSAIC